MVEHLIDDQIAEFKEVFTLLDKDGDGTILTSNLGSVMRRLGLNPTKAELDKMVHEVDVNADGNIDFEEEFLPLMAVKMKDVEEVDELAQVFVEFDREKNGLIAAAELRHLLTTLGEPLTPKQVDGMIAEIGCDSQGNVDYRELCRMMLKGGQ
eukprot:TRINITY_DN71778_c0_g1_i1.p1 TRINITY_DN71778_c0_g1~~TRINITY_DN71778_c0_g1_i1.p1  ORF type:complete len:153 (+),score=48.72 TRINITY_DN71778_c0_g1_i1:89-547(+)